MSRFFRLANARVTQAGHGTQFCKLTSFSEGICTKTNRALVRSVELSFHSSSVLAHEFAVLCELTETLVKTFVMVIVISKVTEVHSISKSNWSVTLHA